jgi:hypothetical protein
MVYYSRNKKVRILVPGIGDLAADSSLCRQDCCEELSGDIEKHSKEFGVIGSASEALHGGTTYRHATVIVLLIGGRLLHGRNGTVRGIISSDSGMVM